MKPVVIVGAGLAGLTCARALKRHRIPFQIFEADARVGGRLKSDTVGGFRLDRGFQVYYTDYPTAKDQIDRDKLDLKRLEDGAYVVWDGERHQVTRDNPLRFALSGLLSMGDKLRLGKWTSDVQWLDQADIDELPDRTSEQYLRNEGFSNDFIERFARPFFGSLFADRSLTTSCRQLVFMWKSITEGDTGIPTLGMEELPRQLAATFGPEVLHLNSKVIQVVNPNGVATSVKLESGEEVEAGLVVLATDAQTASALSGVPLNVDFRHTITLYFTAPEPPVEGAWVVLNGNMRGITNQIVPVSSALPCAEPLDKHLIAAVILGERPETDEQLAEIVKSEMRVWFEDRDADSWEFLRGYRIANATIAMPPGFQKSLPSNDSGIPGLFFAGEYTTNSSIDGAIRSGVECADLILSRMEAGVA